MPKEAPLSLRKPSSSVQIHMSYRHTQIGHFIFLLNGALGLFFAVQLATGGPRLLLLGLLVVIVVSLLFGTMTVEVGDGDLRFRFGPGGWGKRVPLAEIADAQPDRSVWWEGIGIRITSRGMLYNVAVGRAVSITLRSGRTFRLGSDEPERLAAAIIAARDGS